MNLQQFISKYKGKYLEVAGSSNALNQCVDLANGYLREVLGLPIIEWTNAVDFPSRVNPNDFNYIKNTPEGVPEAGDLIIWGGTIGHIAIFVKGDVNWFTSFDQNWPTGSVCHLVDHSYSNVKGWLRMKGGNMNNELEACMKDRKKFWEERDKALEKIQELEKEFELANKKIDKLIEALGIAENKAEADLAKAKVDYEKLLADEKVAFTNHCERLEEKYREDLKDLEQKYKDVNLPEPEKPLLTFKEKVAKALEILFS